MSFQHLPSLNLCDTETLVALILRITLLSKEFLFKDPMFCSQSLTAKANFGHSLSQKCKKMIQ